MALDAALRDLETAGGVDALVKNAGLLANMTRSAAVALGLPLLAPVDHGDALTAIKAPAGIEIGKISKILKGEFKSEVAGGQGRLKGQIMRVAHLGYYDVTDILGLLGRGASHGEILEDYPMLEPDDISAVLAYAAIQADHAILIAA